MVKLSDEERQSLRNASPATPKFSNGENNVSDNQEFRSTSTRTTKPQKANRIGDVANVDKVSVEALKFRETAGELLLIVGVDFVNGEYHGKQNTTAWVSFYYSDSDDKELKKAVGSGYAVVEQLKMCKSNNLFPILARFIQNPERDDRWELVD